MKDNKLYKVLRIIFLTLAILSLIFSLSKKFVHAASSSSYSSFPLPVSNVFGFSSEELALFDSTIQSHIGTLSNTYGQYWSSDYVVFVRDFTPEGSFYIRAVNMPKVYFSNNDMSGWWSGSSYLYYKSSAARWGGSIDFNYNQNTGVVQNVTHSFDSGSAFTYGQKYISTTLSSNGALLANQTYYPLYLKNANDLVLGNNPVVIFTTSGSVGDDESTLGGGSIIGTVTDFDGNGFDYDLDISIDLNPLEVLGEEIRDGIGTLKDRVVEGFQTIGGKIDTFKDRVVEGFQTLTSIPSKVSDIYDYITQPFDEEKFSEKFEEMELGQEISTFRTDIESFTGTFDVAPAVADDVKFTIPFTLPYVNQNLQAVIDFSFYDRIRSIIVPFFTVFLIFGMVWSLIRSIPGILHGTSPDGDS